MTTRIKLRASIPLLTVRANPGPGVEGAEYRIATGDYFLTPGRTISLYVEESDVTSNVTVQAINGDVEVRVLEGARSQPREIEKLVVEDGGTQVFHVWKGHWVECKEL